MNLGEYAAKLKKAVFKKDQIPTPPNCDPWPITDKPLYLEIGCGAGLHPILFAKENPDKALLACERTTVKFQKFLSRCQRHQLSNIYPIHHDAFAYLKHYDKESFQAFEGLFLLYPNPYPKNTHRNKRFLSSPAFSFLLERLKPKALITLRTNESFYKEEALYFAEKVWGLILKEERQISAEETALTHFEKKYLLRGETCFELVWRKK